MGVWLMCLGVLLIVSQTHHVRSQEGQYTWCNIGFNWQQAVRNLLEAVGMSLSDFNFWISLSLSEKTERKP